MNYTKRFLIYKTVSMGITGLLPFLDKSSRRANIKEFSGQTVAIDAYCWLHKGAFSCADKLIMNEPTFVYINYCMKFINMLLSHNIKPILVFDGRYLPAKAEIEKKRRENRSMNRKKGAELLRAGQVDQGRSFLRRSVDVTHKMALNLIKQCRERNVDCIVAPYEADAQLAYLNVMDIAQLVITEDSDLLLFGCIKVLFKMDINGNGILIEKDKLHISMGVRHDSFSIDKFRYMCILSGCDYLPSLPGIGLSKARKFINRTSEENMYEALLKLPVNLQMWTLAVTDEYRTAFIEADRTFRYQLVYDPIRRRQVPLNASENDGDFVGEKLNEDLAFQLAIGNIDPMTMEKLDDYNPDKQKSSLNNKKNLAQSGSSIWSNNFIPKVVKHSNTTFPVHTSTKGLSMIASVSLPFKKPIENNCESDELTSEFLNNLYGSGKKSQYEKIKTETDKNSSAPSSPKKSPILFRRKNPFAVESPINNSAKRKRFFGENRLDKFSDTENLLRSRYFDQAEDVDVSPKVSNNMSVLDLIEKEENGLNSSKLDESQKESGNAEENENLTSFRKSNSELKESFTNIQTVASKIPFNSMGKERNNTDKGSTNDETPKENSYISSDVDKSENGPLNIIEKSPSGGDNCMKQKLVLSPVNDIPSTKKKFYYACKSEDGDKGHTSPYFQKSDSISNSVKILESESPVKSSTNTSLIRSAKKSVLKRGLSKSTQRKQQSLLTRFGFQPRPKLQGEKT